MSKNTPKDYTKDTIRAIDAKFEAQKIAFAPLTFQAVRALLELGLLKAVSDSGEQGISLEKAAEQTGISRYGAQTLLEIALGMNLVKILPGTSPDKGGETRFVLGKTGWFLLEDEMTRVNFNFINDVCYKGAFELKRSIEAGKPLGLEVFGREGKTIYELLAALPEKVKESWFAFDHFYSDIGFEEALPIVFSHNPRNIIDIGGNTAKWAICCCRYNPQVEVTIVDLPGQTQAAGPAANVYVLEPFWDKQRFEAASYSLQATSLYFTCMANGNSKMYRYGELAEAIERAGFDIVDARHNLGSNDYSLLCCRGKP